MDIPAPLTNTALPTGTLGSPTSRIPQTPLSGLQPLTQRIEKSLAAIPADASASGGRVRAGGQAVEAALTGRTPAPAFDFDALVVGSGYGGSVAALRLAESGLRVAVLERGRRRGRGEFPTGEQAFWDPAAGTFGPHAFRDMGNHVGWTGSGNGGGSLINAAIMLRKKLFKGFPNNISAESLDPYYTRVEKMLDAKPYPAQDPSSPHFGNPKTMAMIEAAEKLGKHPTLPLVAITYRKSGEAVGAKRLNEHGSEQEGCRDCGECSLPGCNYAAKNSLDHNYLFKAENAHGAKIFTQRQADRVEPLPNGGYLVHSIDPETGLEETRTARVVVVSAGTYGSTELLLRNKELHGTLPNLSPKLGENYTTNGNFIGFVIDSDRALHPAKGPEITAGVEFHGKDGEGQGFYVFDGSYRDPWAILGKLIGLPTQAAQFVGWNIKNLEKLGVFTPETTLPLLVLGRDQAVGRLKLDDEGKLTSEIDTDANKGYYKRVEKALRGVTKALGGTFLPFPMWHFQRKIEVPHPLGGAPMGTSARNGVVDDAGRVFGYDGLVVLDGSIMPGSLGVNPALTIAAVTERAVETIIAQLSAEGRVRAQSAP